MAIDNDVALFERIPTLRLLGTAALNALASGAERRNLNRHEILFRTGDAADSGYVVQRGAIRVAADDSSADIVAGPGMLIGELALIAVLNRGATAIALQPTLVLQLPRSLFLRVLENHPDAARRLRDDIAARTRDAAGSIAQLTEKLT
jgi:CRP-like cAMP-binding protein